MTPGEQNTGTPAQSPLVSLTSVTPDVPAGTVKLTFSAPITQALKGTGGGDRAVRVTDPAGNPVPGIDETGVITGVGTNTLTVSFAGPAVTVGILPPGNYRLTFNGHGLIGNGRATDADLDLAADLEGANGVFDFTQPTPTPQAGDYDRSGAVTGNDFLAWQRSLGAGPITPGSGSDGSGNGMVDEPDLGVWRTNYGEPNVAPAVETDDAVDSAFVELARAADALSASAPRPAATRGAYRPAASGGYSASVATATAALGAADDADASLSDVDDLFAELGEDSELGLEGCGRALVAALA